MELFSLQPLSFFLLFLFIFLRFYTPHNKPNNNNGGFLNYPIVGTLPEFLRNRHRFLDWSTEVLRCSPTNTATFWRPMGVRGMITSNPSNVEHMLKTNFHNYPKGDRFLLRLHDFLGGGIFNSDGDLWNVQRKTASHEFNTKSLRSFAMKNVAVEIQSRLAPILERACETKRTLDLQDVLERFAFDNICKVAFNVDPACLSGDGNAASAGDEFMRAFEEAATLSQGRFMAAFENIWRIKRFLHVGSERRLRKSIRTVHDFADKIIRSRIEENKENKTTHDHDLLSRFIADGTNSAEFLRDVVISFILAGRDTTSSALTWFFWLLSTNPGSERKIVNEIKGVREATGRKPGDEFRFEELREMNYLHAAITEAMRLYPPVPVDTKVCRSDDVMPDGTFVGRGWIVTYSAYGMGRSESVWGEDCGQYRPERWLDDGGAWGGNESAYRYPVFHAGPRMCLGKDMAYVQMKYVAAAVIERFQIEADKERDAPPDHLLSLTLRMKGGLHVRVHHRGQLQGSNSL